MQRILILAILAALVAGCSSTDKVERELTTYVGDHVNEAIARWGKPDRIHDMQNDTKEYEWIENSANATVNTGIMGIPIPKGKPRQCKRVLLVDRKKLVIGHLVEGKC